MSLAKLLESGLSIGEATVQYNASAHAIGQPFCVLGDPALVPAPRPQSVRSVPVTTPAQSCTMAPPNPRVDNGEDVHDLEIVRLALAAEHFNCGQKELMEVAGLALARRDRAAREQAFLDWLASFQAIACASRRARPARITKGGDGRSND